MNTSGERGSVSYLAKPNPRRHAASENDADNAPAERGQRRLDGTAGPSCSALTDAARELIRWTLTRVEHRPSGVSGVSGSGSEEDPARAAASFTERIEQPNSCATCVLVFVAKSARTHSTSYNWGNCSRAEPWRTGAARPCATPPPSGTDTPSSTARSTFLAPSARRRSNQTGSPSRRETDAGAACRRPTQLRRTCVPHREPDACTRQRPRHIRDASCGQRLGQPLVVWQFREPMLRRQRDRQAGSSAAPPTPGDGRRRAPQPTAPPTIARPAAPPVSDRRCNAGVDVTGVRATA